MEPEEPVAGLSTAAMVAIGCNALVAILLLFLCLVLYRACRVPSSPERLPVLARSGAQTQQANKHKYLLTSWLTAQWLNAGWATALEGRRGPAAGVNSARPLKLLISAAHQKPISLRWSSKAISSNQCVLGLRERIKGCYSVGFVFFWDVVWSTQRTAGLLMELSKYISDFRTLFLQRRENGDLSQWNACVTVTHTYHDLRGPQPCGGCYVSTGEA